MNQIRLVRKMGPLGELMEKFPLFGDLPEGFQFDDQALDEDRGDGRLDDAGRAAAPRRHHRRPR